MRIQERVEEVRVACRAVTGNLRVLDEAARWLRVDLDSLTWRLNSIDEYARWVAVDIVNGKDVMTFETWFETYKEKS